MNGPVLSVILPVYNGQALLDQAVASVLDQDPADLELILVDDGSTDNTPALCRDWQTRDGRVRYLRQNNQGAGPARNLGLDQARGRYVAFLDHDDLWMPDFWNHEVRDLLDRDLDVYLWGSCITDLAMKRCSVRCIHTHECSGGAALREPWGHHSAMFFRRDHLLRHQIRFPSLRYSEDVRFCFQALAAAERIRFCQRPLLIYRQRPGSITKTPIRSQEHYRPILDSWLALETWIPAHAPEPDPATAFWKDTLLACTLGYLQAACGEGISLRRLEGSAWLEDLLAQLPEKTMVADAGELELYRRHPRRFWLKYRILEPLSNLRRRAYSVGPVRLIADRLVFTDPLPILSPEPREEQAGGPKS